MQNEIYDNYDQEDQMYHAADDSIQSETMEKKDPAINQHYSDKRTADHQPTELDHDDADRRTLDESIADEDEDDEEE